MDRVTSYRGFTLGDLVEARMQRDGEAPGPWRKAVFCQGDMSDDKLPFAVKWGSEEPYDMYDYNDWVRSGNLRKRGTPATPRVQWKYGDESDTAWVTLEVPDSYAFDSHRTVQFREAPARSDAEKIAAAIEAYDRGKNFAHVIDILKGNA